MVSVHDAHNGGDIIMNTIAWIAIILAAAATAASVATTRRQRRLAKRIRRLEQRTDNQREQLLAPLRAITAASIEQQLAARGGTPRLPIQCRSEFGEDLILAHLFADQSEGYYIEVGAYDGQTNAVSWIFDAIGWKGLLVEAIPERAEQARIARPNAAVIHAALSHKEQLRQQTQQQNQQASPPTIELTIYPSALESELGSHITTVTAKLKRPTTRNTTSTQSQPRRIHVPLTTLANLLEDPAIGPPTTRPIIDFAVIDVEGAEHDVIKGLETAKHKPRVLIIEDHSMGKDHELTNLLTHPTQYTLAGWIAYNRVLIRSDEQKLLEIAAKLFPSVPSPHPNLTSHL